MMTNLQCDNILNNSLTKIFKNNIDKNEVINDLNTRLSIDEKLILLKYYMKYKFDKTQIDEIDYKKEDSLPDIIHNSIQFIINDIVDTVGSFKSVSKYKMLEEVNFEIYRLLLTGKNKFGNVNIKMYKKSYNAIVDFLREFLNQNNKEYGE